MFWTVMGYRTKEYIATYVLWDIADRHNAIIMNCSCSNLGICVLDVRHTVNTVICKLAHQQWLSSLLSQVDFALLVTSPECLPDHDSQLPKQLLVCAPM